MRTLWATWVLLLVPLHAEAAPSTPEQCRTSDVCEIWGWCTPDAEGTCRPGSDADCVRTPACSDYGQCHFDPQAGHGQPFGPSAGQPFGPSAGQPFGPSAGGLCAIPETTRGCQETPACKRYGRCTRKEVSGKVVCAVSDSSCQASAGCKASGLCAADPVWDWCVTSTACPRSRACALYGLCGGPSGERSCSADARSCKASEACRRAGACVLAEQPHSTPDCVAGQCAGSVGCTRFGRCQGVNGYACAASDCAETAACKEYGACGLARGSCNVRPELMQRTDAPDTCEVVAVTGLTATATSAQAPWKTYLFDATQAVDGRLATSWQPAKKKAVGEVLTIRLPRALRVARVDVFNGFQTRDPLGDELVANGRIGDALITLTPTVRELMWSRFVTIGQPDHVRIPPTETDTITIEVLSAVPGELSDDLAVSEVKVFACK